MQADLPFYDSPEDALKAVVQAMGGFKDVGKKLFPHKDSDIAGQALRDALNPNRSEKLELGQVLMLLRMARDAGHHSAMFWIAGDVGYDAKPISREDEIDRVASVVESTTKTLASAVATLERLQRARAVA